MPAPTYDDIWQYARQVQAVSQEARDAFILATRNLDFDDWANAAEQLRNIITEIVDYYGLATSELGAQWYEYCRALGVGGEFSAIVEPPNVAIVKSAANAEIDKLFNGTADTEKVVSLLQDVVMDQVTRQARDTIVRNLGMETAVDNVGYARVPVGDTCAFCIMLASRGFVYPSKKVAERSKTGEKYHPNCNCVAVPFHKAETIPGYADELRKYEQMYFDADNLRRSGEMPKELKERIQEAKKRHNEKYEQYVKDGIGDTRERWKAYNEITMIMRWQNEGLH